MGQLEEKLKDLIKRRYGGVPKLAEETGVPAPSIYTVLRSGLSGGSVSTVLPILAALGIDSNWIIKNRLIEIGENDSAWIEIPLYGTVAAGLPVEMIEDFELKEVPRRFVEDDPECFLVKAKGGSETRRGIFDGDFVLISPKYNDPKAHPNELFLTAVNGDEATIKQVAILENGVELIPDSYDPTYTRQLYNYNEIDTPPVTTLGMVVWHCAAF